jgi:hypothetical protein
MFRPKFVLEAFPRAPQTAATTMNTGRTMSALAIVAEMKAERTTLMTMRLNYYSRSSSRAATISARFRSD